MPTYNFLLLELSYEYQNRKIIVVFCVNFCFLMLSFCGFLILLFLICFFRHFIIPISVDYQYVTSNQQDFKKKVIDCVFKLGQLNNIPEKYVEKNSDCSRSSVGRVYRCNFDGRSPIPNWTTIFNFFSCVIGKATIIVNIPEVLCWILKLFLGDSADVGYTVDDSHHIRIDIQFHDDKTLFLETGEKEGKVKKKDGK